jgi:hypothetical protein
MQSEAMSEELAMTCAGDDPERSDDDERRA